MIMDFNAEEHLNAVTRAVGSMERDGQPAREVTLSRAYPVSVSDLWDAVTGADRIPSWFMPVSGDLRLGGRFQLEGNAGGTIITCERPSSFAVTWEFGGDVSWVDVRIEDDGAGCARLRLSHTALLSEHWEEFGPGATGMGWEMGLTGLALHLAQPDEPKLDEEEFAGSSEGRALMVGSSDGWARASIEAGGDADAARAAAARTATFYTGEA